MMKNAILATLPSDSHTWNLVYIQLLLQEYGYNVENLGSCTPIYDIIEKAYEIKPSFIVISSINGHGYLEAQTLIQLLREEDFIQNIPVLIGGKLTTNGLLEQFQKEHLYKMGYSGVFPASDSIDDFRAYLNEESKGYEIL